jgi:Rrf2 family protein
LLTAKGKYGLKAMTHLARLAPGEIAQVSEIAEANSIPKKFLDQIFSELRKAGFVFSKKGKAGGYALAKEASSINVGDIVRVLDGPLAPIPCASVTAYRACDDCDCGECEVRAIMVEVRNAISVVLDNRTLAQFAGLKSTRRRVDTTRASVAA